MPSRRQIRETAIQFLYCADLEGGPDPTALRDPFWKSVTESDRRNLQVATYRTVHHLAHGRQDRLAEFIKRTETAKSHLTALPEASSLADLLTRLLALESSWSMAISRLAKIPKDGDDADVADGFERELEQLFQIDRDLSFHREKFLTGVQDFPVLKAHTEAVSASIKRLQRISDRIRMVEEPEKFPEQTDLSKIRNSKSELNELRIRVDELVDSVLASKETIDAKITSVLENYAPERVDPIDRAILRLATYELLSTDTPAKVVINEAIELAKRFGTTDSKRFVNGILDKIAQSDAA